MIKAGRLVLLAAFGAASLALASCGDAPSATAPAQTISQHDLLWPVTGLLACKPLPADSVTQVIGPDGGTINIGPHSFTVPAGALDSAVAITAVAPSGFANRVVFQPAGLVFLRRATLTMSYANCGLITNLLAPRIAYVDDLLRILYTLPSLDNAESQTVTARVRHFSDYAVAW
ncbi:MAG: hypothetical protein ACHQSE_11325 [Gemmatimonadales bacterium]